MWDLSPLVYILYVHKKKTYVFLMWDLKLISIYIPMFLRKSYFFNVGFEVILYI